MNKDQLHETLEEAKKKPLESTVNYPLEVNIAHLASEEYNHYYVCNFSHDLQCDCEMQNHSSLFDSLFGNF